MRHSHHLARHAGLALVALLAAACGGSGGSGGGGGVDAPGVMWPDRGGGTSDELPAAVVTGRVVFESASGETCCVAVDPELLTPLTGPALLVLDDLPPGPATVTIAGFSTDFAPSVPGIMATCRTVRPAGAAPCDPTRVASAAFESAPLPVNIIAGVQINLGEIDVSALPFVLADFAPAQEQAVPPPVRFDFTIADAVTGVAADSVALDVTVNVPDEERPSQFRSLTKRIPLTLTACADGGATPCSADGDQALDGFEAAGVAERLPEGPAEVRITGQNLADPARLVDFRYIFNVLPEPTETPTTTPTGATQAADGDGGGLAAGDDARTPLPAAQASVPGLPVAEPGGHAGSRYLPTATPTMTPIP